MAGFREASLALGLLCGAAAVASTQGRSSTPLPPPAPSGSGAGSGTGAVPVAPVDLSLASPGAPLLAPAPLATASQPGAIAPLALPESKVSAGTLAEARAGAPRASAPRADAEAARGTAQSEARAPRADAEAARGTAQSEAPAGGLAAPKAASGRADLATPLSEGPGAETFSAGPAGGKSGLGSSAWFDGALERRGSPAPVQEARRRAAASEPAAKAELRAFLRRAVAVERRNARLAEVQAAARSSGEVEKRRWIDESNRLQELPLETLIETFYPADDARRDVASFFASVREADVTINVDPAAKLPDGRTVLQGLLADGEYKNFAQTGVTQGLATPERARSEDALFGLAGAKPEERPKYAALNLTRDPAGGAPRYTDYMRAERGVYLVLKEAAKGRSTLTARDTLDNRGMTPLGTFEHPASALADLDRAELLALFRWELGGRRGPRPSWRVNPEVQVFGPLRLDDSAGAGDVAGIVADATFRETPVRGLLEELARRYRLRLDWTDRPASSR